MYRRFGNARSRCRAAAAGIVLLSPPSSLALAVCGSWILPGLFLFRQNAWARKTLFSTLKFRTMYADTPGRAHASAAGPGRHDHALRAVSAPQPAWTSCRSFLIFLPGR